MQLAVCFLLLCAAFGQNEAAHEANGTYSFFLPKYVRPGTPNQFLIGIMKSENPISVKMTLKSKDWMATDTVVLTEGMKKVFTLDMIPYDYDGSTEFIAEVFCTDTVTLKMFANETTKKNDIQFQKKFLSIFIQTDKAIYQRSQMIKFRAVVTTSDLLPFDGKTTYKLSDPNGNVIIQEKDADLVHGVVGSEFQLGRYATLGDWKLTYQVFGFEESLTVSVEEYKLPKFKVEINPDKTFLHPGSTEVSGEITAQFTFGQPVKGTARIEFTIERYRRPGQIIEKIVEKYPEFDGSATFSIPAEKIEKILKWNPKHYSSPLKVMAFVIDKTSQDEFNASATIDLQSVRLKVEAIAKPDNIKPGLPYVAYIKVSEQDGTLLSADERKKLGLNITMSYSYPYNRETNSRTPNKELYKELEVGEDGIAVLEVVAEPDKFSNVYFNVKIESYPNRNQYWTGWSADRFDSPSNTYLQVSTVDNTLAVGDKASIVVQTTEKSEKYAILVLARGKMVSHQTYMPSSYEESESSSMFEFELDVTSEMSPSVFVVVLFVRPDADAEIVGDSIKINVQASLKNKVVMTTSTDKTDAAKEVIITVNADPGSFVGLRAIDQSVLLLKKGNDITQDKIFEDLDKYGTTSSRNVGWGGGFGRYYWPYPIGGADIKEVFDNSGVIVLTDALLYSKQPEYYGYYYEYAALAVDFAEEERFMSFESDDGGDFESPVAFVSASSSQSAPRTRSYFPESWIWTDSNAGTNGSTQFTYKTPDTITTWELSSFAVSSAKGLGVTKQNSKITVFRNFFISLNLPPTMIRGEILNMRTTLFNYFDDELIVTVTLQENEWYDLVIIGDDSAAAGAVRTVTVPSKDSMTVVFPIKFKKAGNAKISVMATSFRAGDAVERILVVKPEGIPKTVSHSTIVDRQSIAEDKTILTFDADIPKDAVEGSAYVKFSVSGNVLGSALNNLGNLLQMPGGCGEQTMLNFAPDVFISLYLQKVGELTGEIKQKSKSHIQQGYQNELRYQREDGSFSAFGSSDRSGSTWLTAFVVKSFIAAKQLNDDLVEDKVVNRAIRFILNQQQKDGSFEEPGRVIHTEMQGGVENKETMAAYVLLALAEGDFFKNKEDEKVEAAIKKTQKFLESRVSRIRDTYTLSIVAYALSLVESEKVGQVMSIIDSEAVVKGNLRYWEKQETGVSHCVNKDDYCPFNEDESSSSSIEITSYILLTYVKMGRLSTVMPMVRWLVEQRGAFGGYHSTQDTVMAIQALATVAGFFTERPIDLTLDVTHDGKADFSEQFIIHKDNTIILQMVQLPAKSGTVTVTGNGVGFADVQVTVAYNLPVGPRSDEPFTLDVKVKEKKRREVVVLEICSRINENRKEVVEGTGMFVISTMLPSGYTVDDKEATRMNKQLKLVETVGTEVSGYFDELPKGKSICMTLNLIRYAEVSSIKPQLIKVFDYYKPRRIAMEQYLPMELEAEESEEKQICDKCGSACVGCPDIPPLPTEKYCQEIDPVPCPDLMDGLYYDTGSHIAYLLKKNKYTPENSCSAPQGGDDSENTRGLPGTLLNGVDQFILCEQSVFKIALMNKQFTISLLVYPTELDQEKRYTIFSIGGEDIKKPLVYMEKRPRVNQYWVRVRLGDMEYTVRSIYLYDIPLDRWTQIAVTFDGSKLAVYIDGHKRGKLLTRKVDTELLGDKVTLKLGRSHVGNTKSRGDYMGLVSSLDFWYGVLSMEQIEKQFNYYMDIMFDSNPLLSLAQVHHVVPSSLWPCFEKSYSAADLKARAGKLRTSCEDPDLKPSIDIPPPFPILGLP